MDKFDEKLPWFYETFETSGRCRKWKCWAFSVMLAICAQQLYCDHLKREKISLTKLKKSVRMKFFTPNCTRNFLCEWDAILVTHVTNKYLELFVFILLGYDDQTPLWYLIYFAIWVYEWNHSPQRATNAVRVNESFQFAYQKHADELHDVFQIFTHLSLLNKAQVGKYQNPNKNKRKILLIAELWDLIETSMPIMVSQRSVSFVKGWIAGQLYTYHTKGFMNSAVKNQFGSL